MTAVQMDQFRQRVERIEMAHGSRGLLGKKRINPHSAFVKATRPAPVRRWGPIDEETIETTPNNMIWAFLLGLIAVCVARYFSFQTLLFPGDGAEATFIVDVAVAGIVALGFALMFGLKTGDLITANVAGVAVALSLMHNLVWMHPDGFVNIYGAEWVETVKATTQPNSIWLHDTFIPIG